MRVFRYCSPFDVLFGYENEINYRYRSICALSCYIRYAIILRSSGVQDSSNRIKLVLVSFTASHLEYRWTSIYWYFARSSLLGNTSNYNTIFICWLGRFITTCLYPKRHISLIKDRFSGLNEITDIWKSIILGCATYKKISAVPRCSFRYLIKAMCNLSCFSIQLV